VTYPKVNDRLRTNESFRTRSQSRHHKNVRSIIKELTFDIVKKVPVHSHALKVLEVHRSSVRNASPLEFE
jgi:hypothetical protein